MRRKIELWVGNLRADLAEDSFVLLTYTMEDLANPAIVRNSFSKQIRLPGTTANNRIFGEIFRNDRQTQYHATNETGINFDPTRKTTWRIYNERSEVLDSGYLRLNGVKRKRNTIVEYTVTLYGGLGSFLYGLAYNESGEKRTLADLDFLGTANPATEMNFTLNAAAVRAAWTRIAAATGTPSQLWDIINFAPAYNGKPGGTFDADKGLLDVVACGIAHDAVGAVGGLALVELAKEYTEWQTKDLRSYLQRPVVRLRSIIEAICASRNNNGWSVVLDGQFFNDSNPYWHKTWMTLPILDTDNIINNESGGGNLSWTQVGGDASVVEATINEGSNMFNKAAVRNGYIHSSSGAFTPTSSSNYLTSPVIPVQAGHYYLLTGRWTDGRTISCLDANGNPLKVLAPSNGAEYQNYYLPNVDGTYSALNGEFKVPAGAVSVQFTIKLNDSGTGDNIMLVDLGTSYVVNPPTPEYEPYGADPTKNYVVDVRIRPVVQLSSSQSGTLYLHCDDSGTNYMSYVQYLVNAYNASNTLVASTAVRVSSRQPAAEAGDVPQMDAVSTFTASGNAGSWNGSQLSVVLSGAGITRVRVTATTVALKWGTESANDPDGNAMWTNTLSYASLVSAAKYYGDFGGSSYSWSEINGGRSGKNISKAILLSGGGTPADYLLSLCKAFGLVIVADGATKTVSIEKRSSFYQNTVVDITDRIDMDEGFDKEPFSFDAKWYVWAAKYENGEWAKAYAEKYGRVFGQQRVDTGYSFDANTNAVLDSAIFRGAVMALENAKYYCAISEGGYLIPSVLLDRGAKYSITATEEVDINVPSEAAAITWMNPANPSYDLFPKAQFHDKDDAAFDERDTLLFFDGMTASGSPYTLTDDTQAMLTLNGGTPCWLLQWTDVDPACAAPALPKFSRYLDYTEQHQGYVYERSLDFGTPAEVPIPAISFRDGATVWPVYWARYIADRYDDDSAVVRCKVNLAGMQVGPALLRQFYWFDGAVWALNRIINHSMTTLDLTECEFVKVQDIDNYTE